MIDTGGRGREPLTGLALNAATVVNTLMVEGGVTRVQIADVLGIHANLLPQYLGVRPRRGGAPRPPWRALDMHQMELLADFFGWSWGEFIEFVLNPEEPLTSRLSRKPPE